MVFIIKVTLWIESLGMWCVHVVKMKKRDLKKKKKIKKLPTKKEM